MKHWSKLSYIAIFLAYSSFSQNKPLLIKPGQFTVCKPEEVGFSSGRLKRVDELFQTYLDKKWIPGGVAAVARKGKIFYEKAWGESGIEGNNVMQKNDLFRIASMTKPVTSVALMILYEEGRFVLDEPVSNYIPEFKKPKVLKDFDPKDTSYTVIPAKSEITIRQLLTHTSGIGYGFTNPEKAGAIYAKAGVPDLAQSNAFTIGEKVKILAQLPLMSNPGEKWTYGLSTDVLGYLVEIISGMKLGDFCEQRIFKPLGMTETNFFFPKSEEKRLVAVFGESKEGISQKYSDEKQIQRTKFPVDGAKTYFSGGSGLVSTAGDYLKFLQFILNKGQYNGNRVLSRKTVDLMTVNQIGNLSVGQNKFGFGFAISTEESSKRHLGSVGKLSWSGVFATFFWIDPKEELIGVLMMQIYPSTHSVEISEKFENAIYQALE